MLPEFESLADQTGIALPDLLRALIADDLTHYGPDWKNTWKQRLLDKPPAFSICWDFEWAEPDICAEEIDDWLNPESQQGRCFLPFAQSGAGDLYCLMPYEDANGHRHVGVAFVWHDDDESEIEHASFEDFACSQVLNALVDLRQLSQSFSTEEVLQIVQKDVHQITQHMAEDRKQWLRSLCAGPLTQRDFRCGPKAPVEKVWSLISQELLEDELAKFTSPEIRFPVTARWDCATYSPQETASAHLTLPPPPAPSWKQLALDPAHKMAAIQLYQKEHSTTLLIAKQAVDQFIQQQRGSPST